MADEILIEVNVDPQATITVEYPIGTETTIIVEPPVAEVSVITIGVAGPEGPRGLSGNVAATYMHVQSVASDNWEIAHNLGKYPSVVILDSSMDKEQVFGDVRYIDLNNIRVSFSAPFSGEASMS